jgi:hypothetical protein
MAPAAPVAGDAAQSSLGVITWWRAGAPGSRQPVPRRHELATPGWNQPYLGGRSDENVFTSSARSYADRPVVSHPHALHFMGMSPAARYRHMAAVAKPLSVLDVVPAELG